MKKAKMRGGIKRQGKGSWVIVLSLGRDPVTGKYRQKWVSFKGTWKEAEDKRDELRKQLRHGDLIDTSKMTLADFLLNKWLPNHAKLKDLAPKTVSGYRERLQTHIIPALGHVRLGDLKPIMLKTYYAEAMTNGRRDGKGGLSGKTMKQHHAILHAGLKAAVDDGMISRNPAEGIEIESHSPKVRIFREPDDLWRFLDVVKVDFPDCYALFYVLLFTGVRRNEALGLTWGDINLSTGSLSVKRSLNGRLKTEGSERAMRLPETANLVLRAYRERREAVFADMGLTLSDDDHVFSRLEKIGDNGRPSPMLPDSVTHTWIKAVRRAGFQGIRLHDARHTHISWSLAAGNDLAAVAYLAGHSSVRVTADTYADILESLKQKAAESFDRMASRPRQETTVDR